MIYDHPAQSDPIDQGDILFDCPLARITSFDAADATPPKVQWGAEKVIVLTQTCDLAQRKVTQVVVAVAVDADDLVRRSELKAADIRGPIRSGRVFGLYFLPADAALKMPELIIDFRQLYTIPLNLLLNLCQSGRRRARVRPLFREHLARHFADSYSRIGLPEPYFTE